MSLRKGISLLLLAAFLLTSVPVHATVTLDSDSSEVPLLTQDAGLRADGANRDVVPVELDINFGGVSDIFFAAADTTPINGAVLTVGTDGQLNVANGTGINATPALATEQRVAVFVPPTGTQFVKLASSGYTDTTQNKTGVASILIDNGANSFANLTVDAPGLTALPSAADGTNSDVIFASILEAGASDALFGAGSSTSIPAGSLVLHFLTTGTTPLGVTAPPGTIEVTGIGLAASPTGDASIGAVGDDLNATYKAVGGGSYDNALLNLANNSTLKLAKVGASTGKVEVVLTGETTGTETVANVEPDAQSGTLIMSQATGDLVNFGPGHPTLGGTPSTIDVDALLLRGSENDPGTYSTASTRRYHETPFATSEFTTNQGHPDHTSILGQNGDAQTLSRMTLEGNTVNFPNVGNSLMKLTFELRTASDQASSASLALTDVFVSLIGARGFAGYNRTQNATINRTGFLGSIINGSSNGSDSYTHNDADWGLAVIGDADDSSTVHNDLLVRDVAPFDYDPQATIHGVTTDQVTFNPIEAVNGGSLTGLDMLRPPFAGIFPGSLVTGAENADDPSAVGTWDLVNTARSDTTTDPNGFTTATSNAALADNDSVMAPGEVTARLRNTSTGTSVADNAWFVAVGDDSSGDNSQVAGNGDLGVASTNLNDTTVDYMTGFTGKATAGEITTGGTAAIANNAVMVAKLDGNTLKVLPITNKLDGVRDVIAVRPLGSLTLNAAARTEGVKLVVTASGGNIDGTVTKTLFQILPTGGFNPGVSARATALPVYGALTGFMQHLDGDNTASRASFLLSSVAGTSTANNTIAAALTTGNVLDETLPPLFCGGTAGNVSRGPNGVVFQPKARGILLEETTGLGFGEINGLGSNVRLRITLPTGMDLHAYSTTVSDYLSIVSSAGFTPTISRVQPIADGFTSAFVEINIGTTTTPAAGITRALGLIFEPNALVAPKTLTDFNATVSVIDTAGTNALADDTNLATVGTVALADACSMLLTVSYCPDSLSSFQNSTASTTAVESTLLTQGASQATFPGPISAAKRLVVNATGAGPSVGLPDLCIEENLADAFPVGGLTEGVPNAFGLEAASTAGRANLHLALNEGTDTTGAFPINFAAAPGMNTITFSDNSLRVPSATSISAGEVIIPLAENTGIAANERPVFQQTRVRVPGLAGLAVTPGSTVPPAQDILAWLEVPSANNQYIIGSNSVRASKVVSGSTYFVSNVVSTGDVTFEGDLMFNLFNAKAPGTPAADSVTITNWTDATTGATNDFRVALANGEFDSLPGAICILLDSASYQKLSEDTKISVQLDDISGSTDEKTVTISVQPGSLEPGTLIAVTVGGSGDGNDTVTVPVLDDGSFQLKLRANTSQTMTITQTPATAIAGSAVQSVVLNVAEQNVEPVLVSAVSQDVLGLGTVDERGNAPVLFRVTATGKIDGNNFVPTADQLKLGNNPVMAVPGTTDTFISVLNFKGSAGDVLTATVTGFPESEVALSGLDSRSPTLSGRPVLNAVKTKNNGKLQLRGRRLRAAGQAGFILDDGSFVAIQLKKPRAGRTRQNTVDVTSIPTNAVYAVYSVPGRGIDVTDKLN